MELIHFDSLGAAAAEHEIVGDTATNMDKEDYAVNNQAPDELLRPCVSAGRRPSTRTIRREFVTMLFALLSLMLLADFASAATPAGKVDMVNGSCTAHGRLLRPGDGVPVSASVEVPPGGRLKLRMADGSLISIAADSRMTVVNYDIGSAGRHAKLSLTRGLLRAVVVAVKLPSTFEVSTPVGTASVLTADADWFIESQPGSARVGVEAGKIQLTSAATASSAEIPAKWGGSQLAGREPAPPRPWPQEELDDNKARTD